MSGDDQFPWQVGLYIAAVLIPLAAFTIQAIFIRQLKHFNAYIATGAIFVSFVLSFIGFVQYFAYTAPWGESESHAERHEGETASHDSEGPRARVAAVRWTARMDWISLGGLPASAGAPARPAPDRPPGRLHR